MKCQCDFRNMKWEIHWALPHLPPYLCPVKGVTGHMSLCQQLAKCALGKLLILSLGQRNSNSKAFNLALICPTVCRYRQLTWWQINTWRTTPFQLILVFQNFLWKYIIFLSNANLLQCVYYMQCKNVSLMSSRVLRKALGNSRMKKVWSNL